MPDDTRTHNERQIRYYSSRVKSTLRPTATPYVRRHLCEVLEAGQVERGHRLLEVGCGMGRFTLPLAEAGYRVEGVELTPFLIEQLRAQPGGCELTVHCCDVVDAPGMVSGSFDRVVGFFTLHHVQDLRLAFAAIAQVLGPGGRVAFTEPNPFNPLYYVQIALTPGMTWAAEKGLLSIRRPVIEDAATRAGLTDLTWRFYGFFPRFVANLPGMSRFERGIERLVPVKSALPFQVMSARRP